MDMKNVDSLRKDNNNDNNEKLRQSFTGTRKHSN
jgi:hypothetical protein